MQDKASPELLKKLYWQDGLSIIKIARKLGVADSTIKKRMRKADIPRRSLLEAKQFPNKPSKEKLRELYSEKRLTQKEIGKLYGVKNCTIGRWLHETSIPTRHGHGESAGGWKGGRYLDGSGYIHIYEPDNPHSTAKGYIREHIKVWEETHNKKLPPNWIVHHINGVKTDNRPSNLLAMPTKKHDKLIPNLQQRIRELEVENRQFRRALEDSQMLFVIGEN